MNKKVCLFLSVIGIAIISLSVTFSGCVKEEGLTSSTPPKASFTINPDSGDTLTTFIMDASACSDKEDVSSGLKVRWDYDNDGNWDTQFSSNKKTEKQYTEGGYYIVKMEVKDSEGLLKSTTNTVTVSKSPSIAFPIASFLITPLSGTAQETFTFNASTCTDDKDSTSQLKVRWDWDNNGYWDTEYTTIKIAAHKYDQPGNYIIRMEVKDSDGLTAVSIRTLSVFGAPVAEFSESNKLIIENEAISFTDESINMPSSWSWDFGDGNTSTEQNPTNTYSNLGFYTVTLTATNDCGSGTKTKTSHITVTTSDGQSGTITDVDGNTYQTVIIGTQTWMAENLKTTKYNNGTSIPNAVDNAVWRILTVPAYCWYENNISFKDSYGALYNGYTITTDNLCPIGWHVPSDTEWKQLEMELGMSQEEVDRIGEGGTNEGSKLAGLLIHWGGGSIEDDVEFGTSGFNAEPGGRREYIFGTFDKMYFEGSWWTSTSYYSSQNYFFRYLKSYDTRIGRHLTHLKEGASVRCVKD